MKKIVYKVLQTDKIGWLLKIDLETNYFDVIRVCMLKSGLWANYPYPYNRNRNKEGELITRSLPQLLKNKTFKLSNPLTKSEVFAICL